MFQWLIISQLHAQNLRESAINSFWQLAQTDQPHVPTMGKFPKFFISLDHAKFVDSSRIWIKLMNL